MKKLFIIVRFYLFIFITMASVISCSNNFDNSTSTATLSEQESVEETDYFIFPKHKVRFFGDEDFDKFYRNWYGHFLYEMGEKPLGQSNRKNEMSYRFLWLRTFHPPIIININKNRKGTIYLRAKLFDGAGGYEPGKIIRDKKVKLTGEQWKQISVLFSKTKMCNEKPKQNIGLDGAQWVFESYVADQYCAAHVHTPGDGVYKEFGLYLLSISGLQEQEYQSVY